MPNMRSALVVFFTLLSTTAFALPAGGHMGGGGWSSGTGTSGGTGVGLSPYDGATSPTAAPVSLPAIAAFTVGALLVVFVLGLFARAEPRRRSISDDRNVRVGVVHVALLPSALRTIQHGLAKLAATIDTTNGDGRITMLHETATLLRQHASECVYLGGESELPTTRRDARRRFNQRVTAARALLASEPVVRVGAQHDSYGLILVTLIVAARTNLFATPPVDHPTLAIALRNACNVLPHELMAVHVVWTPATEEEPLTAFALEARLGTQLTKLAGTVVGTSRCAFCNSAYRAEHVRCPHCGGQADMTGAAAVLEAPRSPS